ncbi:preprotein translocase subunit SecG [Gammaproteobacteria bacterium]|nr:preprotein translocase subunit SecG [Gammaproteobacteria bacterium]
MLITILTIINVTLAIILVILVILQQGKGSDLGSAFGGGSSNSIFGAVGPSNFLGKITSIVAAIFLISCLAQAYFLKQNNTQEIFDIEDSVATDIEQEVPTE